jgi:hypothetical protein
VKRLPNNASIFSADSSAILLALDMISQTSNLKFLILSDSLSCINSIENKDLQNPFIVEISERQHKLLSTGVCITFVWVPSHIGIAGNTAANATAKAAICLQISNSLIPYSDLKPLISSHLNNCWQQSWKQKPITNFIEFNHSSVRPNSCTFHVEMKLSSIDFVSVTPT